MKNPFGKKKLDYKIGERFGFSGPSFYTDAKELQQTPFAKKIRIDLIIPEPLLPNGDYYINTYRARIFCQYFKSYKIANGKWVGVISIFELMKTETEADDMIQQPLPVKNTAENKKVEFKVQTLF